MEHLESDKLGHTRSCHALNEGDHDAECTCGLEWRIQLQTEQTMHAAWRKRAEESEKSVTDQRAIVDGLVEALKQVRRFVPLYSEDQDYHDKIQVALTQANAAIAAAER